MLLFRLCVTIDYTGSHVQEILLLKMILDTGSNEVTHALQLHGIPLVADRNGRATIGTTKHNTLYDRANRTTKCHHQPILVGFHVHVLVISQAVDEGFVRETQNPIFLRGHPARPSKSGNSTNKRTMQKAG